MPEYKKILAVIDTDNDEQKSLNRAVEIAAKTQASITAFLTVYDFSYDMTTMLSADERESMRQAVIDERTEWMVKLVETQYEQTHAMGLSIDVKVVWHNRPYESIIYEVIENHYDLVVKGTSEHDTFKSVIFTPTDWHLMRKCPCSVLLVKEHAWPENGKILGAINAGTEDEAHLSLNKSITKYGKYFAGLLNSKLHLVNTFPGTPVNIAIDIPEFNPADFNESVKRHHEDAMSEHASHFSVPTENCHVNEGLPEDIIPQLAQELDTELVILGTVGRLGISAALIGNTAEHVIDKLNCDVLTLKPDGFVSPVKM